MTVALPEGFEALAPFAPQWAVAGTANRAALRGTSTGEERAAFYATALPLVPAALDYLDARPLEQLDATEERLMNLVLSFAHISIAIEVQQGDEAKHTASRVHMRITRASADWDGA